MRLVDLDAVLAVGILVATIGAFVGGTVAVSNLGVVELTVNRADAWPAYAALALALLVALVALGRSLIEARVGTSQRKVRPAQPISSRRFTVDGFGTEWQATRLAESQREKSGYSRMLGFLGWAIIVSASSTDRE